MKSELILQKISLKTREIVGLQPTRLRVKWNEWGNPCNTNCHLTNFCKKKLKIVSVRISNNLVSWDAHEAPTNRKKLKVS